MTSSAYKHDDSPVFVASMIQHRRGLDVRDQPQFGIHHPLYSNPPLRLDARFVLQDFFVSGRRSSDAAMENDSQADIDGPTMLAVDHILRR